jgi:hypothetical protein
MIQLVYASTSVNPFTNEELLQLLEQARQNNERLGITGMLLYESGDFMQALEGEEDEVHSLCTQIARDPRHKNLVTLLDAPCAQREFPDWSMGFRNLDDADPRDIPGYSTFLDSPLRSHTFLGSAALCRKLLLLFKAKPEPVHARSFPR